MRLYINTRIPDHHRCTSEIVHGDDFRQVGSFTLLTFHAKHEKKCRPVIRNSAWRNERSCLFFLPICSITKVHCKRRCERRDAPEAQIEARQSRGFWAKGKLRDTSDVIATSAATAAFWLLATTFLLHRPQNRYRFCDDGELEPIICGVRCGDLTPL